RLVTLYFDTVDTAGHEFGPDDPRTNAAIAEADSHVGKLLAGLRDLGISADIVVVADHGMAAVSSERTVALDKLADPALYRVIESGPYAALAPTEGNADKLWAALARPGPHHTCWRKDEIPAHLRYGRNPRVAPILCLARSGWSLVPSAPSRGFTGGAHGYDQTDPDMAALFIANGPGFAGGVKLAPFDNTAITPLLRHILGLPPLASLDGTTQPFARVLKP
ncbi:MAG: alkaline phosphatase family protein, partial [Sphingomonadaceae bacterium]|nr:alkaline phosphatase family protein [Sphingomonadaceae bacterium]